MKSWRLKFSLRQLMALIAISAIGFCVLTVISKMNAAKRIDYYVNRIKYYSKQESINKMLADEYDKNADETADIVRELKHLSAGSGAFAEALGVPKFCEIERKFRALALPYRKRAAYHANMRIKYERATQAPWLPVEPDPPEP